MSSLSNQQIAHMMAHASDDLRPNIIVCVSICAFFSVTIVALRLFARLVSGTVLLLADYLIVVALILYIPFCVALGLCTDSGLGKHVIFVTDPRLLQIYFISSEVIYSAVIVTIIWSILDFYKIIFPQKWFHWVLLGVTVFMGAWLFTTVFAIIFQCLPIKYNWNPTIKGGHCIAIGKFALAPSILNVCTDLAILGLPLPLVWKLNVTRRRRWDLTFLFAFGGSACVVGITRAGWIGKLNATVDPTWDNVPAAYLSAIEVLTGFFVACLPSYLRLFHRATGNTVASSKRSGPGNGRTPGASGRSEEPSRRPVMSWNKITNTDEIELTSQTPTYHPWEALPDENDSCYKDGHQMSTRELKRGHL